MKRVLLVFATDKLLESNPTIIINKINKLFKNTSLYLNMNKAQNSNVYGKECHKILNLIEGK